MNNNFISLKEYKRRLNSKIKFLPKRTLGKRARFYAGVGCLIIAFIPNGLGLFFYPLGFFLVGIKKEYLFKKIEGFKFKMRGL